MNLLAFDPGRRAGRPSLGWALFKQRLLVGAGVIDKSHAVPEADKLDLVLIEVPRWYPREKRIDVNDLLDLSVLAGELKGTFEARCVFVQIVWPRSWKGAVPKKIHNDRVLGALLAQEKAVLPRRPRAKDFDHNMIDAIGIGLWKLERM